MKPIRTALIALACVATPLAMAQWQWVDKDGRKVFSDQAPPPGTPADKILSRPGARSLQAVDPAPAPASAAAPKVSGKDKDLEEKRKQAAAADAAKKRAEEDEIARQRADNCERAKRAKATIDSGVRLSTVNDKGETEIMNDNARAAEAKRVEGAIARDCKGAS